MFIFSTIPASGADYCELNHSKLFATVPGKPHALLVFPLAAHYQLIFA